MKFLVNFILLIALLSRLSFADKVSYKNYKVYRLTPKNEEQMKVLKNLENESKREFSFWTPVRGPGIPVDILVSPSNSVLMKTNPTLSDINMQLIINDVQELIDNEENRHRTKSSELDWTDYYTLDEINEWLVNLTINYPDQVTLIKAGSTYQDRDILGVQLSFNPNNSNKVVFLEGNIHANEWISSAVVTFILNQFLTSNDTNIRNLAENYDWIIVPVFNPDGYVYTWSTNRLWRKTLVPYGNGCYGADPNRNWDFHYNEGGTSNDPCTDSYRGPYAFSEPCTKSLSNFISTIGDKLAAYIGFHSYSQLLLIPFGYTTDHLDNYDELKTVGLKAVQSLSQRYGTNYTVGNVPELLYVASGGSPDWVKGTFGTRITYTYELRDTGEYGFLLPADQIIPTGLETLDSLLTIFNEFSQD